MIFAATEMETALQQAKAAMARGTPHDSERIARDILSKHPQHPVASHVLGVALLVLGRPQEAVGPLRDASKAGADPVLQTQLATALRLTGEHAEAERLLTPIVAQRPPYAPAFHELAALLHSTRRFREADDIAARGLAAAPQIPDLWIVSGMSRLDLGDRAGARVQLAKALSLAPEHPRALHGLGSVCFEEGDFGKAAEFFQRALSTRQAPPQTFISLASCLFEMGRSEDGLDCLRQAIAADPGLYAKAVKALVTVSRGQFSLRPSDIEKLLKPQSAA